MGRSRIRPSVGGRLRGLFDLERRAGLVRRPLAQDELKLHSILRRRLAREDTVTASDRNRVALAPSIGTEGAQVSEEIICACRAADPDAEGHPVHSLDLPLLSEGDTPCAARFIELKGGFSRFRPR